MGDWSPPRYEVRLPARHSRFSDLRANGRWLRRAFGRRSSNSHTVMRSKNLAVEVYTAAMHKRDSQVRQGCTVRHFAGISRLYWRQRAHAYRAMGIEP